MYDNLILSVYGTLSFRLSIREGCMAIKYYLEMEDLWKRLQV